MSRSSSVIVVIPIECGLTIVELLRNGDYMFIALAPGAGEKMFESLQNVVKPSRFRLTEIMTPWAQVQTEPYSENAFQNCAYWIRIFDYIPLTENPIFPPVKAIVDLELAEVFPIEDLLVKPSAHLLEAFRISMNYENGIPCALLVGTPSSPRGIITHADLNKPQFRTMLYIVFNTFEVRLSNAISAAGENEWWLSLLPEKSVRQIEDLYSRERNLRVDFDKLSCCHFSDKIRIIQKTERLCSKLGIDHPKSLSRLVGWRNRLVHPTHPPRVILNKKELSSLRKSIITIEEILPKIQ